MELFYELTNKERTTKEVTITYRGSMHRKTLFICKMSPRQCLVSSPWSLAHASDRNKINLYIFPPTPGRRIKANEIDRYT